MDQVKLVKPPEHLVHGPSKAVKGNYTSRTWTKKNCERLLNILYIDERLLNISYMDQVKLRKVTKQLVHGSSKGVKGTEHLIYGPSKAVKATGHIEHGPSKAVKGY